MPEVFQQLQELDEKRIRNIRNFMVQSANVERNVFPIINQCLDGIVKAANTINEKEVIPINPSILPWLVMTNEPNNQIMIAIL